METWLVEALKAAAVFLAGIGVATATPIIQRHMKEREVRQALYSDLGRMYHILSSVHDRLRTASAATPPPLDLPFSWDSLTSVNSDLYQHYFSSEPSIYLGLDEAAAFTKLYEAITTLKRSRAADLPSAVLMVEDILKEFEQYLRDGAIDENLLLAFRSKHRAKTIERLDSYYRSEGGSLIRDNHACVDFPGDPSATPKR